MNKFGLIVNEVKKAVSGKDKQIVTSLVALLAGGNILIEDIPGVGKTTLALAFSRALDLDCNRVQFTPDTLPSDITGFVVFNKETGRLAFNKGAVFCNLFLADELNRTSSRTQSALLEAMEEKQVTVEGRSYALEPPFAVIATQNPIGASGTQLLPDSQVDRFMVKISMGYPSINSEIEMLKCRSASNPLDSVKKIVTKAEFSAMQNEVNQVYAGDEVISYIVSLTSATRNSNLITRGASPRASLSLMQMSKSAAYANGYDYVTPKDVQGVFLSTFSHRIILSADAHSRKLTNSQVLTHLLSKVNPPRI